MVRNSFLLLFLILILLLTSFILAEKSIQSFVDTGELPSRQMQAIIADHTITNMVRLDQISDSAITNVKSTLHIAYGHTSHGSQITTGMNGLSAFKEANGGTEGLYDWNDGSLAGYLDLDDYFQSGDLGNPDRTTWASLTREYLDNPAHSDVNVVIWSWCGQVSSASEGDINTYLSLMSALETDYPEVKFVYMTGHTDGTGLSGNLHIRNNQIRDYCTTNGKILYDFADIECYDPDGNYFGDKDVTDSCNYNGGNWAIEWQNSHTEGVDWYECSSAHSEPLNANLKAYAAWWLWARLAGWNDNTISTTSTSSTTNESSTINTDVSITGIISAIACTGILIIHRRLKSKKD
ncbi:MAG: hypothetical protein ACFFCZ_28205 [Promethearchaeota archaeon]